MTELDALRLKIDGIDEEIVRLLEDRMQLAREIGACKASCGMPVLDPERETVVIESRTAMLQNMENAEAVREIYKLIMQFARENQGDKQ